MEKWTKLVHKWPHIGLAESLKPEDGWNRLNYIYTAFCSIATAKYPCGVLHHSHFCQCTFLLNQETDNPYFIVLTPTPPTHTHTKHFIQSRRIPKAAALRLKLWCIHRNNCEQYLSTLSFCFQSHCSFSAVSPTRSVITTWATCKNAWSTKEGKEKKNYTYQLFQHIPECQKPSQQYADRYASVSSDRTMQTPKEPSLLLSKYYFHAEVQNSTAVQQLYNIQWTKSALRPL